MVQGIDGVVIRAGQGEAVCGFFTVADAIILEGAIHGIGGFIGSGELAPVIVGVGSTGGRGGGATTAGDACALSYIIHRVVNARNDGICRAVCVGNHIERITVRKIGARGLVN